MSVGEQEAYWSEIHPGQRWYAVQTQPHKERVAGANLEQQGFPAFIPSVRKTVRHARRTRVVLKPLFQRYLFVSLDLGRDRWRSVNGTLGVTRLVTDGFMPVPLPSGLVEELIAMTEELGAISLERALEPGKRVRFLTGPFADTIGQLLTLDDAGRALVLVEMLGSPRRVVAPAGGLASVFDWDGRAAGA